MQVADDPAVSVIIPAYNEAENIAGVLERTEAAVASLNLPFEVIVVNDGSSDDTYKHASGNGAKVISYEPNRGKGYALRRGLAAARGHIIITLDADGSHRPDEIPRLIRPLLYGFDVVIGSRFLKPPGTEITTKLNTLGNGFFNLLILILTKKRITDSQTGFRAFKRRTLQGVHLVASGYEIESEITIKTLKNGFKVCEEAISCDPRNSGRSKLKPLQDGLTILKTILKANFL